MAIKYLSINNEILNISELIRVNIINNLGTDGHVIYQNGSNYQTISGINNIYVIPELKGTAPNINYYRSMALTDKTKLGNFDIDTNSLAKVELQYRTDDGQTCAQLMAYRPVPDVSSFGYIRIGWKENQNTVYTYCPTPANTSNTTEIATTQWVQNLLKSKGL